jgi:23S rRNA (guanine745-N1)-methyltransferase
MLADVLRYLRCPVCAEPLTEAADGATLRCPAGHSFDRARQGYTHLGVGRMPHTGDAAPMVSARADFLAAGHYAPAGFAPTAEDTAEAALTLGHREVATVVGMGPSAWHIEPDALAASIATLPAPLTVTLSVRVTTYRPA